MKTLIKREFIVNAAIDAAFDHLAQVEKWPCWAKYIRRVELNPPGPVTAVTQGTLYLTNNANLNRAIPNLIAEYAQLAKEDL